MTGRAYIPRMGRDEESLIARVQLTGQLTVTFFCWPPQTNTPLFFGLSKSIWDFEIDGLDRWDIYYSSYWSRILKKSCRVITTFGFIYKQGGLSSLFQDQQSSGTEPYCVCLNWAESSRPVLEANWNYNEPKLFFLHPHQLVVYSGEEVLQDSLGQLLTQTF